MVIRNAKKYDAATLARLAGELGYPTTTAKMKRRLEKLLSNIDHAIFVAELDAVVGWIHVSVVQSLESDQFAEIHGLVVTEAHRNSGIGTQLIAKAEIWAQKKRCRRIRVRTNIKRERTRQFYKILGYTVSKTQEVFDKQI